MTTQSDVRLEMLVDREALSRRVADWMLEVATTKEDAFAIALSGGSTRGGFISSWPDHLTAISFPGLGRIGFGATNASCLTTTR